MSEITWPKLVIGALLTAGLSVGGNQLAEKRKADNEIRQETRKKQITALENCRRSIERVNAPLIVIKGRGPQISTVEVVYEIGQVTTAMERLYDDSLALDVTLPSSKKIAELNETLTTNIRRQQLGGSKETKQFVKLCTTEIPALVSSTKDAIQQDWQTMTHP